MATPAQQQQFVSTYYPYAQQVSAETGLDPAYVLGQAANESAWGTSNVANTNNNFFGINVPGGNGSQYASYSSPADSFQAYANLMQSSRYAPVVQAGGSPYQIASGLAASQYSTDPNYGSAVAGTTAQVQSILGGTGSAFAASPGETYGQPGADGLIPIYDSAGQWTGYATSPSSQAPGAGGYGNQSIPGVTPAKPVSGVPAWAQGLINAFEGGTSGFLSGIENWFLRGGLILLALLIIFVALWRASGVDSEQITKIAAL